MERLLAVWKGFRRAMTTAITWTILGVLWVVLFVPGRLSLLILRRDPMSRRFPGGLDSFWQKRAADEGPKGPFRQS